MSCERVLDLRGVGSLVHQVWTEYPLADRTEGLRTKRETAHDGILSRLYLTAE